MLISHLDFKGVLPRAEHLPQLLEDIAARGFDGVLVEYEDVFPFEGVQLSVAPEEKWSRETLQNFLDKAADLNLEVIPFQQCLGPLEWVFRWEKWRHFALDLKYPSTLDIFNADAKKFVFGLFEQVLDAHPRSRFVHVGLDEAHALVSHARENNLNAVQLLLDILEEIYALCEGRGVTPLIFTDVFENNWNTASLQRLQTFRDRVVMTPWDYSAHGERLR